MAAADFVDWWNEHSDSMVEWDWDCVAKAAWNAAEEKFNSALRQPTKQGSEPSEICPKCGSGVIYTNDEHTLKSCCHCNHEWPGKLLPC